MSMAPCDFPDDDDDGDHSQPDAHDDADLGFDAGPPAGALDPLAAFLKELEDLDSMSGPDIMAAMADLPFPQEGFVDGMAFQDAVEVLVGKTHVMKSYMISYMISLQAKLLPAHNMENSRAFTRSERILLDHQNLKRMNAVDLRDLIRDVLHNPEFNASEVDHDMHERLMRAVEEGEMEIIDMWQDGDGAQDVRFFKRKVEIVLRELLADERLEGCQHFAFKEYKNAKGERILGGHANGSISFQLAQLKVGPGKVPISIVLYIDATFIKRGIPIRPIYCESVYDFNV